MTTLSALLNEVATSEHSTLQVDTIEKVTISGVHVVPLSAPLQMVSLI